MKHTYSKQLIVIWLMSCIQMSYSNFYGIVLAGGVGERLWPLSRQSKPKQFLALNGSTSLLRQSIERLKPLVDHTWIVTGKNFESLVKADVGNCVDHIVTEPSGRNTGPAILYTCLEILKTDPDAVLLFVPADPYIPEEDYGRFRDLVLKASGFAAEKNNLVLLGVKPTYAATGYGYIEYDQQESYAGLHKVARFHEKPSLKLAQTYLQMPSMLWNIGMFCGKASLFVDQFKKWAPEIYEQVMQFTQGQRAYHEIESLSVDYALIEKSDHVWVQPADFSWCDVGNVDVFLSLREKFKDKIPNLISISSSNNIIEVPNKLVALIGINDLCIVETDDALLITKRADAEHVRAVVKELKEKKQAEYL